MQFQVFCRTDNIYFFPGLLEPLGSANPATGSTDATCQNLQNSCTGSAQNQADVGYATNDQQCQLGPTQNSDGGPCQFCNTAQPGGYYVPAYCSASSGVGVSFTQTEYCEQVQYSGTVRVLGRPSYITSTL